MFSNTVKVLAACIFASTQAVTLQEPDLIAMALANSLSSSASHLVQMAATLTVDAEVDAEAEADAEADYWMSTPPKRPKGDDSDASPLPF